MDKYKKLFQELIRGLSSIYCSDMKSSILFGSVARGTATPESDIDIAVIVDNETSEQHSQLLDLVTDLNLDYDVVLSVLTINADRFEEWGNVIPFYKNVQKEGIQLWKAA